MSQPNIVLIHGHDLGRWLSCYGPQTLPTPQLAAFAERSVVFERAFSTAPLCTPARSSLFTGVSPHVNGLFGLAHDGWRYRRSVVTLPEMLAPLGYDTALVGLQHEHPDSTVLGFSQVGGLGFLPRAESVADAAVRWLAERDATAPFFLTVGMWEIHRPWPASDYEPADPATVAVPAYLPDNADTRADLSGMYGSIAQLDAAVGRVLEAVDRWTDPARTLVIFTTDHGAALPRAKGTLYDTGLGVAMIVRPPTAWGTPPRRVQAQVSHLDIAPTLVELAGGAPGADLEGTSLLPYLRQPDPADEDDRTLYFEKTYHDGYDPIRAVRTARWKYIRNFAPGPLLHLAKDLEDSRTRAGMGDAHLAPRPARELYDLVADPDELVNLADRPELEPIVRRYDDELLTWMRRTRDPLLDGPVPPAPHPTRQSDAAPDLV